MIPTSRLFLLSLLTLAGCISSQRTAYHVDIANVSISNATLGASEAVFTLKVANTELYPTVVEKDTHRIFVNGTLIGDATGTETYALMQLGVATRVLTVQLSGGPAIDALRAAIQKGGGEYQIETRLSTNSGGERSKVNIKSSGTFTISGG